MPTAVVTGANSGIAHAFAKLLLDEGYTVYAVDRVLGDRLKSLSKAHTSQLDVTSTSSIAEFRSKLSDTPIDLLLNIAGGVSPTYIELALIMSGIAVSADKDSLETTTLEILEQTFAVNTYGPMLLTQALLPNILKSDAPKIGIVTSRVGSIGDNSTGGMYAYRSSKAAANSIGRSMAMDLRDKNVVVMMLHPGFVRSGLLPGADGPEFVEPEEAAMKLWENTVSQKTIEDTGKFWHREGQELIW